MTPLRERALKRLDVVSGRWNQHSVIYDFALALAEEAEMLRERCQLRLELARCLPKSEETRP